MKKKYEAYKPSGVDWMGDIPSRWGIIKLKYKTSSIRSGGTPASGNESFYSEDGIPWVAIADMSNTDYVYDTEKKVTEEGIKDKSLTIFPEGTLLYSIYATLGKVAILKTPATINQAILAIALKKDYNQAFLKYNFKAMENYVFSQSNGNTQYNLNAEKVSNFLLVDCSLPEQNAIANYLDAKCAKIDNVVDVQQKRIELLKELKQSIITKAVTKGLDKNAKMKDSGIEWIGEVPEDWRVMKINYLVNTIADVNHYMPNDVDCGYPYVMTGDIKEYANEIDFENCKQISETDFKELSTKVKAEKGDVIFARYATIGTVCYVDIEKDFIVSYSCVTIKPKYKLLLGKYLYYYLKSQTFFEGISQSVNSNTQGNVGIESLSAEKMVVPSIEEQTAIAAYLDAKCATIDKQISKVERQIELLKEYKQSVITECVTGKRKVC